MEFFEQNLVPKVYSTKTDPEINCESIKAVCYFFAYLFIFRGSFLTSMIFFFHAPSVPYVSEF